MPWEGRGTRVITPEACVTVCLAVLEVIPGKAERTRRGTSCQVAGGFEERTSRGHPTPAPPQNHESRAGSSTHILPAEYAPVTHRRPESLVALRSTRSAWHRWSCHDLRQCLVAAGSHRGSARSRAGLLLWR